MLADEHIRPMLAEDLDAVDSVLRLAFGTIRGLPDPSTAFGDADLARTRFAAAPDHAWVAELEGEIVGSVFAAQWGSFAFLGPLSVHPDLWDRGIGGRLLVPVLDAFAHWGVRQAGLFTFASSGKHLGLYEKNGFRPGSLTAITARQPVARDGISFAVLSEESEEGFGVALDEIQALTDGVFPGLDLRREIVATNTQSIGDTIVLRRHGVVEGMAVCHRGAGSEAGSGTCYVKFAAARPGTDAPVRFERLLDACETFASASGLGRIVAGVNTGRLDAYLRLLARSYRVERVGLTMRLRSDVPCFDTSEDYVIDDLR